MQRELLSQEGKPQRTLGPSGQGLVPRHSQRQVPTHQEDFLPWKSCLQLQDEDSSTQEPLGPHCLRPWNFSEPKSPLHRWGG